MPEEASIVRASDQVVAPRDGRAGWMDVEAADPASARLKNLDESLFREIVGSDAPLISHEEDWFRGVKMRCLWGTASLQPLAKGKLGEVLGEGMDGNCSGGWSARVRADCNKIISMAVKRQAFGGVTKRYGRIDACS